MCVAYPLKVVKIKGKKGVGEAGGLRFEFACDFCPELRPGDFVLVHAGCAIERIDPEDAEKTLLLYRELREALDD
ncbi:MAG: HypC/HybG/HupF family hydrogenase formation chaperone [Abditibacteriota bacterium]|nr:HypC/HybG/HupF family hydrogenase formation chaperone [Abditibacteriota bacterium]